MKRTCFWIDPAQDGSEGWIPSVVTEGEPGHSPLKGNPEKLRAPWIWGVTLEQAQAVCAVENAKNGVSPDDALEILMSSMRAS